ncbi:hypothetical protein RND81_02G189900 [Saponaria officinalis]|uniref:Uncharacterized protein n=1 Tax=Saponaria officinalis TaxID=3572 RepID=A0AAW1MUZ2_SAPOF
MVKPSQGWSNVVKLSFSSLKPELHIWAFKSNFTKRLHMSSRVQQALIRPISCSLTRFPLKITRNAQKRTFPKNVRNFLKNLINHSKLETKFISKKYEVLQSYPLKRISSRNSNNP